MTQYENLTGAERKLYVAALAQAHGVRIKISVYDRDEKHEEDLDVRITGGQVDCDADADIVRQLSLDCVGDKAGHLTNDKFIRVTYEVEVGVAGLDWVQVPVFFGPITRTSSDADVYHVEASSKESLMLPPVWFGYGRAVVDPTTPFPQSLRAFISMVAQSVGETKLALGHSKGPAISLDRKKWERIAKSDNVWTFLQRLARGSNRNLAYRGNGVLALEVRRSGHPRFIFRDGRGGTLVTKPSIAWDMKAARNAIRVMGPKTKQSKTPTLRAKWQLPRFNYLSPGSLSRGGAPRFLMEIVDVDAVLSPKQAREIAHTSLNRLATGALDVAFTCLPVPHLEPGDLVAINAENFAGRFVLKKYTLPLGLDEMSIGFNRNVSAKGYRGAIR
jgi:hypothetical protein